MLRVGTHLVWEEQHILGLRLECGALAGNGQRLAWVAGALPVPHSPGTGLELMLRAPLQPWASRQRGRGGGCRNWLLLTLTAPLPGTVLSQHAQTGRTPAPCCSHSRCRESPYVFPAGQALLLHPCLPPRYPAAACLLHARGSRGGSPVWLEATLVCRC